MPGYIYLIHEREFLQKKEDLYTIGRTSDIIRRFKEYPKGSMLLFTIMTFDEKSAETAIIKQFTNEFKLRSDIGNENFEGDYKKMIKNIIEYVLSKDAAINVAINITDVIIPKKEDPTMIVMEYVDLNRAEFSKKQYKSKDFYKMICTYITEKKYNISLSYIKMLKELETHYKIKCKNIEFNDGEYQAIIFPYFDTTLYTNREPDPNSEPEPPIDYSQFPLFQEWFNKNYEMVQNKSCSIVPNKIYEKFDDDNPDIMINYKTLDCYMCKLAQSFGFSCRSFISRGCYRGIKSLKYPNKTHT